MRDLADSTFSFERTQASYGLRRNESVAERSPSRRSVSDKGSGQRDVIFSVRYDSSVRSKTLPSIFISGVRLSV